MMKYFFEQQQQQQQKRKKNNVLIAPGFGFWLYLCVTKTAVQ